MMATIYKTVAFSKFLELRVYVARILCRSQKIFRRAVLMLQKSLIMKANTMNTSITRSRKQVKDTQQKRSEREREREEEK
jgi:hypothetical protein